MVPQKLRLETPEEKLVYWVIVSTWGIWLVGGLYLVGAGLGYFMLAIVAARFVGLQRAGTASIHALPMAALVWSGGMLLMCVALIVAHIDEDLGLAQTVKSLFGWLKGWALMAVFPAAGAMLSIRPIVIIRATSVLALQTLLLAPVFMVTEIVGLPATLYVSPLQAVLGVGPEFMDVSLYQADESTGKTRWRFFSPWATAAAFYASLGAFFALQERSHRWMAVGLLSTAVVCYMAGSRLSLVALPAVALSVLVLSHLWRPATWLAVAAVVVLGLVFQDGIITMIEDATEAFNNARAASSRVRAALGNIAAHRWWTEAPIFGHGALERGGHVVERMLIGSHHTWWGLLFVKGAVGFVALAIPMGVSLVVLVAKAQADRIARVALAVMVAMLLFSLGDNLEIIAYLIWPALVLLGIAFRRPLHLPPALRRGGVPLEIRRPPMPEGSGA